MRAYQPPALSDSVSDTEKPSPASTSVAPLVQFFELVHIGDMIQSIVQVYFNKELVRCAFLCSYDIDVQFTRFFRDRPPTLM